MADHGDQATQMADRGEPYILKSLINDLPLSTEDTDGKIIITCVEFWGRFLFFAYGDTADINRWQSIHWNVGIRDPSLCFTTGRFQFPRDHFDTGLKDTADDSGISESFQRRSTSIDSTVIQQGVHPLQRNSDISYLT